MSEKLGWLLIFVSVLLGVVLFSVSSHGQALSTSRINLNNSCPVGNPPTGTAWACLDVSGNLACTKSDGSSCLPSGVAGVVFSPTVSQTITQPSTGGSTLGTSLNANDFEQVRYADQFAWSQSPAGTISIGVNTITINSVRGISQYSFAPGVNNFGSLSHVVHQIRIAGTGTPEAVTVTGSTCIGSSSGTCTITFTAANSHSAGFTVGTATAGFQEAVVDTFATSVANGTGFSGWTIKGSPYLNTHKFIIYGTLNIDEIIGSVGPLHLDCQGATLESAVSGAAMITVGGNQASNNGWPSQTLIDHCHFALNPGVGRAATGAQVYIWDKSQSLTVANNNWDGNFHTDFVDRLILVSGDQHFTFEKNVINTPPMLCDATWCGSMIYGDNTNNAAIGAIYDNYMNGADGIEWVSHNGLTLHGNVFQSWYKFPWRYEAGLAGITDLGGNYYEGNCALINPDFGVSGYSCNTGRQVTASGSISQYSPAEDETIGVVPHTFSATGANVYTYYIVGHDGSGHSTRPLYIGKASTNGVTNFTILFLKFGAATYDVLRSGPYVGDGNDAAPYGTGNWAVSTGIVCAANPCSFVETFSAPTAYTVAAEIQGSSYSPTISYWPVPLFMSGVCLTSSVYIGPSINGYVNDQCPGTYASYYDAIFTSGPAVGGAFGAVTGMRIRYDTPLQASSTNPGALILNADLQSLSPIGRKGRINMPSQSVTNLQYTIMHDNLLYQTFDPDSNKTLATVGHQPLLNAAGTDCGMGYDNNASYLSFMCGHPITFYVAHVPDSGVSYKLRIGLAGLDVPTGSSYTINGNPQSIDTMFAPGSNTEIISNQGGTPGTVAGFTVTAGGNVNVPGTLGVTGLLTGTTATYSGNVTVGSLTTAGSGAMHIHSTFGNTQATPAAGENGMTFLTASGILQCYQNGGALGSCSFPLFNAAGTQQVLAHPVAGTCTLGTSCAITLSGSAVYTSNSTYFCWAQDQTAAAATKIVKASGSSFTITGTGTDILDWGCIGN